MWVLVFHGVWYLVLRFLISGWFWGVWGASWLFPHSWLEYCRTVGIGTIVQTLLWNLHPQKSCGCGPSGDPKKGLPVLTWPPSPSFSALGSAGTSLSPHLPVGFWVLLKAIQLFHPPFSPSPLLLFAQSDKTQPYNKLTCTKLAFTKLLLAKPSLTNLSVPNLCHSRPVSQISLLVDVGFDFWQDVGSSLDRPESVVAARNGFWNQHIFILRVSGILTMNSAWVCGEPGNILCCRASFFQFLAAPCDFKVVMVDLLSRFVGCAIKIRVFVWSRNRISPSQAVIKLETQKQKKCGFYDVEIPKPVCLRPLCLPCSRNPMLERTIWPQVVSAGAYHAAAVAGLKTKWMQKHWDLEMFSKKHDRKHMKVLLRHVARTSFFCIPSWHQGSALWPLALILWP
jgi:hypothetical protein